MTGDPGLCRTGRYRDANTDLPFQFEPWLKGAPQSGSSMIEDLELALCQPCRLCSAPETSERILRAAAESFYKHFGRAAGSEQNQHGDRVWLEKRCKPLRYRAHVLHAVERCKVGESSIKKRFTRQAAFLRKALYLFARNNLRTRSQRGKLLSGNIHHGRRSIREKYAKAAFREEHRVFAGASTNFQHVRPSRETAAEAQRVLPGAVPRRLPTHQIDRQKLEQSRQRQTLRAEVMRSSRQITPEPAPAARFHDEAKPFCDVKAQARDEKTNLHAISGNSRRKCLSRRSLNHDARETER